jgi:VCBS repeat-containing protein
MSQFSRGIFAALAVSLTFGAAQFALGRDLTGGVQDPQAAPQALVNRTAKADRAPVTRSDVPTQTISLQLSGVSDTSVLVRIPVAQAVGKGSSAPSLFKSGSGKMAVACEPAVSVLTEIAKQLAPGRCVT